MLIGFLIWTGVVLMLVGIGIWFWNSKKAVGFFAGVEAPKVTDVRKYNHAVAKLLFVCAILYELIGLPMMLGKKDLVAFSVLGVVFASLGSAIVYNRILDKYQQPARKSEFTFDPDRQVAVIRSSICTGEKVAGFKDKETGHFTDVMLIRGPEDERMFKETYNLTEVKTEY